MHKKINPIRFLRASRKTKFNLFWTPKRLSTKTHKRIQETNSQNLFSKLYTVQKSRDKTQGPGTRGLQLAILWQWRLYNFTFNTVAIMWPLINQTVPSLFKEFGYTIDCSIKWPMKNVHSAIFRPKHNQSAYQNS